MHFKVGCHVSIAGGVQNAPGRAKELGCETFQIFSRSPQGGPAQKLTPEIIQEFKVQMQEGGFEEFVIHAPYYINFGSAEERIFKASVRIVREELERGSLLGATFVMFHPGSVKSNVKGFAQAKKGITEVLKGYKGTCQLLIEISAGAGEVIGDTFEELAELMVPLVDKPGFGGICYDTQHGFASGYDIRTPKAASRVIAGFKQKIGLEWLEMSHINDSKVDLASHKDRHEHLGVGKIGENGIKNFLSSLATAHVGGKKLKTFPLILETEHDRVREDIRILKKLVAKS
jgi:deoxyribonuclease-4